MLNAGQKYCRIKLPFVIKIVVLSILEWPLKTGFTVYKKCPEYLFGMFEQLTVCFDTTTCKNG